MISRKNSYNVSCKEITNGKVRFKSIRYFNDHFGMYKSLIAGFNEDILEFILFITSDSLELNPLLKKNYKL